MRVGAGELNARVLVDLLRERVGVASASCREDIRAEAIAKLTQSIDVALAALAEAETIQITFRIDIIDESGKVRRFDADRNSAEYAAWRAAVFQRDGFTCQDCGAMANLFAHHIESWASYPAQRFNVENGATLCGACHGTRHAHLRLWDRGAA